MRLKLKYVNLSIILSIMSLNYLYADYNGLVIDSEERLPWFKVSGGVQLEQRFFIGNTKKNLHNGAAIRQFDLDLFGQLWSDLSFIAGAGFDAANNKAEVNDVYVTYSGYKGLGDNFDINIGKIGSSFSLEQHNSSNWLPFLERSIATNAFAPGSGLGVNINKWRQDYSLNVTVSQPIDETTDENSEPIKKSDRLQINARGTKTFWYGKDKLLQLGMYGHFKNDHRSGIEFATSPEAKSRHDTDILLNTTVDGQKIKSKNHYIAGIEFMGQQGPFSAQTELLINRVKRDCIQSSNNLKFKGYYANVNYVLTGEARNFEANQGVLGQITPKSSNGAVEISGRYSYLNLTNKDVKGGVGRISGVAGTWYANKNIAVSVEYLYNRIKRNHTLEKLNFSSIGARLQLVF